MKTNLRTLTSLLDALVVWVLLMILAVCIIGAMTEEARGQTDFFVVRDVSFEGGKYSGGDRDAYLGTPHTFQLSHYTAINWDVDLACLYHNDICMFWNNKIDGKSSKAAYKYASWEFSSGFATKYVDIYYQHHSEHILEEERASKTFPIENMVMFRFKFINHPRRYWP